MCWCCICTHRSQWMASHCSQDLLPGRVNVLCCRGFDPWFLKPGVGVLGRGHPGSSGAWWRAEGVSPAFRVMNWGCALKVMPAAQKNPTSRGRIKDEIVVRAFVWQNWGAVSQKSVPCVKTELLLVSPLCLFLALCRERALWWSALNFWTWSGGLNFVHCLATCVQAFLCCPSAPSTTTKHSLGGEKNSTAGSRGKINPWTSREVLSESLRNCEVHTLYRGDNSDAKKIYVRLIAGLMPVTEGHRRLKCQAVLVVLALQPVTVGLHELSLCLPANFILLIFHESFPISVG